jgi:hypothetical protein
MVFAAFGKSNWYGDWKNGRRKNENSQQQNGALRVKLSTSSGMREGENPPSVVNGHLIKLWGRDFSSRRLF